MGKYIKTFENHSEYEAFTGTTNFILPNVSHCIQEAEVHYNPWVETRVVCKYNVTSTSEPTALRTNYEQNVFKSMEVDGVMLDELVTAYTFDTVGVHTVKYELYDETKLGNNAPTFLNNNLIEATIPSSVTSIGNSTFMNCYSLTSVTIPDSVTSIGSNAFMYCSGLTSVIIPDSVTSIGNYAFQNCRSLTSVIIPNSVTSIGNMVFASCKNLTSIVIPNSVTSIGDTAFGSCSSLTSVTIPDSVTSLGNGAFYQCSGLTSITIPNSVTSIGSTAFQYCSGLTSVIIDAETPPTLDSSAFDNTNDCPIYVPSESVNTYKQASGWSSYANRIQAIQ